MIPNRRRRRRKTKATRNAARKTAQRRSARTGKFVKSGGRKTTAKKRKTTKRKTTKRRVTAKRRTTRTRKLSLAARKKISRALKRYHKSCATPTKRKRKTTKKRRARKNQGSYAVNRRRRASTATRRRRSVGLRRYTANARHGYLTNRRRRRVRRTYRRNQAGMFMGELKKALKLGAVVTIGYVGHRALSNLVDSQVLSRIDALSTGKVAGWRGVIASAITAVLGIPLAVRLAPAQAAPIAAGMAASLIQGIIVKALVEAKQEKVAAYLSGYPDAGGQAYGSYYTFQPHQTYDGMGSYYMTPQMQGFGQDIYQAAAGMGQAPMLMQAAAGYGQPDLYQAAAGMGQAQLTQAAAGTGEYVAYNLQGIGEYEQSGVAMSAFHVDEGIYPNLNQAEQALSVAEAQAGVGSGEVPLQSTVNPTVIADPIDQGPTGSRAGVFQGGGGIFC